MSLPKSTSIYKKLATPELREEVLFQLIEGGKSLADMHGELADMGIQTSVQALSRMVQRYGLNWRTKRSLETAKEARKQDVPNVAEETRQQIRRQLFNSAFERLSVREAVLMKRIDLDEQKVELKNKELALAQDKFQWDAASRVLKAVRENPALLRELVSEGALTEDQRITRLVESLWGNPEGGAAA